MAHGVFIHRADSIYDDTPSERYHFPAQYLSRAQACVGDWILYYEPVKVPGSKGYFAAAKIDRIVPDPHSPAMFFALVAPGEYIDFDEPVAFNGPSGPIEQGLLNQAGRISGRAQAAVRPISNADFNRIIGAAMYDEAPLLPRRDEHDSSAVRDTRSSFVFDQERERSVLLQSRLVRDRVFRKLVLHAYGERCAITGLKLINGGGRAEAEAAHIKPVALGGPDAIGNGLALSGTIHWMFDRGLIGLSDDLDILVSRQTNNPDSIYALINPTGRALTPERALDRPHPAFLQWHREHCFKA